MENLELYLKYRMSNITKQFHGENEIVAHGTCKLTNINVIRLLDLRTNKVHEYDEKYGAWVDIENGVCNHYVSQFNEMVMPKYTGNVLKYAKKETG